MDYIEHIMGLSESELRTALIGRVELLKTVAIIVERLEDKYDDENIDKLWQLLRRLHPTVI